MEFEKAYQKFINGTATPEEIEFVRSEMKKANDINGILNSVKNDGATDATEKEAVKKAIKRYKKKDVIKTFVIAILVMLIISIGVGAGVGVPIISNARDNTNYTVEQAKSIAVAYLAERYPDSAEKIKVYGVEKELEVEGRIKNARYVYVLDVYNGANKVFEIEIDSKTGNIIEVD